MQPLIGTIHCASFLIIVCPLAICLLFFDGWIPPSIVYLLRNWFSFLPISSQPFFSELLLPLNSTRSNPQVTASTSLTTRRPRTCANQYVPSWTKPFPVPQPTQRLVVLEKAKNTFTMEKEVTRVNTNLCSLINVEYMQSWVLIRKMFGQHLDAHFTNWKQSLFWKNEVKNTFYLDHLVVDGLH